MNRAKIWIKLITLLPSLKSTKGVKNVVSRLVLLRYICPQVTYEYSNTIHSTSATSSTRVDP